MAHKHGRHHGSTTSDMVRGHEALVSHRRIVLHTTEGILNAQDLPGFFRRVQADAHLAVDAQADAVHMVSDRQKAWHVAGYNPSSLGIEQCGFASWNERQWIHGFHWGLLRVAAALSNWSAQWGIPLKHSVNHGVCYHRDLGAAGGGHWDPGYHYPLKYVLRLAKLHYYRHHRKPRNPITRAKLRRYKRYCLRLQKRYGVSQTTSL